MNEGKSMEIINAVVENLDENYFIKMNIGDEEIRIPLSEDKPNEVKAAFNKIIVRIKSGEFQIKLETIEEDLFSQVANEYLIQLNREIKEVRGEMKEYRLL